MIGAIAGVASYIGVCVGAFFALFCIAFDRPGRALLAGLGLLLVSTVLFTAVVPS